MMGSGKSLHLPSSCTLDRTANCWGVSVTSERQEGKERNRDVPLCTQDKRRTYKVKRTETWMVLICIFYKEYS